MPLVIAEPDGSIIWYNPSFRDISEHTEAFENEVKTIVKELRDELPADNAEQKYMPISSRYI